MSRFSSKRTAILDTNVWISFLSQLDINHFEAKRLIGKLHKQNYLILIPVPIAFELINALGKHRFHKHKIKNLIYLNSENHQFQKIELKYSELVDLAMHFVDKVNLKSQDFIIFLYWARLKPDQFHTNDRDLQLVIKKHLNL